MTNLSAANIKASSGTSWTSIKATFAKKQEKTPACEPQGQQSQWADWLWVSVRPLLFQESLEALTSKQEQFQ